MQIEENRMGETSDAAGGYRQLLDRYYAAEVRYIAAGGAAGDADFSEMAACIHPDVVVRQGSTVPYGGDWHGIDGVRRFFAAHSETWRELELSEISHFEGKSGLCVTLRMRAIARRTQRPVDTRAAHRVTFDEGLIRDLLVFYLDPVGVRAAALG